MTDAGTPVEWRPCSDRARERSDPLAGTGPRGIRWLLIEVPAAWGPKAFLDPPFDPVLGRAIVTRAEAEGMRVLLVARSAAALGEAAAALPGAAAFPADLRAPEAAGAAVAEAVARFGRLDLLVNCAGATQRGDFLALDVGGSTFRVALIRLCGKKDNGDSDIQIRRIRNVVID